MTFQKPCIEYVQPVSPYNQTTYNQVFNDILRSLEQTTRVINQLGTSIGCLYDDLQKLEDNFVGLKREIKEDEHSWYLNQTPAVSEPLKSGD